MRIIAGIAKGLPLAVPHGGNVRPTSDRVREAIFSSLGARVVGADVLDLFAGSGALGLEAASRGARAVVLVEQSRPALAAMTRNVRRFCAAPGAPATVTVRRGDVFRVVKSLVREQRRFALVFADPPYGPAAQELVETSELRTVLAPNGLLVLECGRRARLVLPGTWQRCHDAFYGDTEVVFLRAMAG